MDLNSSWLDSFLKGGFHTLDSAPSTRGVERARMMGATQVYAHSGETTLRFHELRCRGGLLRAGLLLFSPEVSLTLDEPSITANASMDVLPWNIPVQPYLHGVDDRDRRHSVLDANLRRFPPTFVAHGEDEIFRDAIREFVDRLKQSNIETAVVEEPHMFHVFPILMPWAQASRRVYQAAQEFVTVQLSRATTAACEVQSM